MDHCSCCSFRATLGSTDDLWPPPGGWAGAPRPGFSQCLHRQEWSVGAEGMREGGWGDG